MESTPTRPTGSHADEAVHPGHGRATGQTDRIRIEQHSFSGLLWFMGWLFTIGLLHLPFWKGVLALLLWPYYLGVRLSSLLT